MKIVYIIPGTGGTFYCQNCMRDSEHVHALRKLGHDVIVVPMYLPIIIDREDISEDVPVFFGGINVWLQQRFKIFRKTPRWFDTLLDADWILRRVAVHAGAVEASGLGPMTISMLHGADGNQKKELDRLVQWLVDHEQPDVVHISNSLLLGLAAELKDKLGVPVVCSLQDEETWLDAIDAPYDTECWQAMLSCAENVDALVAVSEWYADEMCRRMRLARDKVRVIPLGIDLENRGQASLSFDPPVIGYLSKMTASIGLGRLVDAFITLKQKPEFSTLKLRATGGQLGGDIAYVQSLRKKLAAQGMESDAEFLDDGFDGPERREFLQSLSILSVPAIGGESFGMYITEALAAGVPVVQPNAGAFPEVIEATGGGIVYDKDKPDALYEALETLLRDPDRARALGQRGRDVVFERFGVDRMAEDMATLYESLV